MRIDKLVKGKVLIKDSKTGKTIIDTHNLVLENGREAFFDFFVRILLKQEDLTKEDNYLEINSKNVTDAETTLITNLFLGTNTTATTSDYTLSSTRDETYKKIPIEGLKIRYGKENIDGEKYSFFVCFSYKVNTDSYELPTLAEAGLMFSDTSLFSRAAFGPLEVSGDSEFDFEYFIYI